MNINFTRQQLLDLAVAIATELQSAGCWEGKTEREYAKIKRLERIDDKISAALYSKGGGDNE